MGFSSSVAAVFATMLAVSLLVHLASLSVDLEERIADLVVALEGRSCGQRVANISMDDTGDLILYLERGCGILLRDLARSDIYLYYRRAGGGSGIRHMVPPRDWWVVEVRALDGAELLNPSTPSRWEGVLDPGEYAVIRLTLPEDLEPGGAAYLILSLPDGDVLVGRR